MMSDLISRQETIKAIEEHANFILNSYPYEQVTKDIYEAAHRHIIEVIKTLPAVWQTLPSIQISRDALLINVEKEKR